MGDVTIRIAASADLDGPTERLFLQLDHELIESSLFTESVDACAAEPVSDSETVPAETFNGLASDGELIVRIIPNSTVDLAACPTSYLQIVVTYPIDAGQDCNGNGRPDDCDIAAGTSRTPTATASRTSASARRTPTATASSTSTIS